MTSDNEKRIQDLTAQTRTVLDQWEKQALATASKYDSGTLTADDMVASWAAGAKLAMTGWAAVATSFLDLPTAPTASAVTAYGPFAIKRGAKFAKSALSLTLAGPLTSAVGTNTIPVADVTFLPGANVGADVTEFRLELVTTGRKAGQYQGQVLISDGKQKPISVTVSVDVK